MSNPDVNEFDFDEWAASSEPLTLEQALVKYITSNLGNTTYKTLSSVIVEKAREFTGITDGSIDIIGTHRVSELTKKYWGGDEEHMAWRIPIIKQVYEINRIYFIGMVKGLEIGFKRDMHLNHDYSTCELNEIDFDAVKYVDAVLQEREDERDLVW